MAKLYPPHINGTIPAFDGDSNMLSIPFSFNKAVSKNEVYGVVLKLKTAQGRTLITALKGTIDLLKETANFALSSDIVTIGQYYKAQIAFLNNKGEEGYFSTIGVAKCTSRPSVTIAGLDRRIVNNYQRYFTGEYQLNADVTEKLYSSYMCLYDTNKNIIYTTEIQTHNTLEDTSDKEAIQEFYIDYNIEKDKLYYIQFIAISVNNFECKSPLYKIARQESITPDIDASISAKLNYDEGYVRIMANSIKGLPSSGSYLLLRKDEESNWKQLHSFTLFNSLLENTILFRDFTIEQGKTYTYAVQQYNAQGLYSTELESNKVYADFEDAFLYDGQRQLKIRFNPQVSSFKTDILESKMDTIGNKYPFFFRNGIVNYKEFPIGGLISYQADFNGFFLKQENKQQVRTSTPRTEVIDTSFNTDLTSDNFYKERTFKLAVLDWLNDGKPKLFRSPSEGNYIVRIMNSSLSPNTTLGRMLHTFSATAYEVADNTYQNLIQYDIIIPNKNTDNVRQTWASVNLHELTKDAEQGTYIDILTDGQVIYNVRFEDCAPGTLFKMNNQIFMIGSTGIYEASIEDGITQLAVMRPANGSTLTSQYESIDPSFDLFEDVTIYTIPVQQWIGTVDYYMSEDRDKTNLIDSIQNCKTEITQISNIWFKARPINQIFEQDGFYYEDMYCQHEITEFSPLYSYAICRPRTNESFYPRYEKDGYYVWNNFNNGYYVKVDGTKVEVFTGKILYYDSQLDTTIIVDYSDDLFKCSVNGDSFSIADTGYFEASSYENQKVESITFGLGVICEMSYSVGNKTYNLEKNSSIKELKQKYEVLQEQLKDFKTPELYHEFFMAKKEFLARLDAAIKEYKHNNGLEDA